MREAALIAAVMPGFGDPRLLPIDDFSAALERCPYVLAMTGRRELTMAEALELAN